MNTSRSTSYRNLPIRHKILLWFVPLLVVTISLTGYFSYRVAADEILSKMSMVQAGTAKQAVDHLEYIAQDAIDISNYLFLTPDIQQLLSANPSESSLVSGPVIESISHLMVTRPYFQFLTIYSSRFSPIQFNNKGLSTAIPFEDYREQFRYDDILKGPVETWSIEVPGLTPTVFKGDRMNKFLLTKVLKSSTTYKGQGVLILGVDELDIRNAYDSGVDDVEIVILNDDGMVLSDSSGQWIGSSKADLPYFVPRDDGTPAIDKKQWVSTQLTSPLTGWHVLVLQPKSKLLEQLTRIQWITAAIAGVTIVLGLFVSWAVSGVITRPILSILKSMKKFQMGNFSEQVPIPGSDEIGQLGSGYNVMVQRVKELIDDVYVIDLRQKEAELKVLQSQINPHFLYNTLNTIAWAAQRNNDPKVADMIYALSNMFRISLSEGKEYFALSQEFKLVEHYLYLQQSRNPNKLGYELEMDDKLADFTVPKLLIQPLVENAVVHGIEPLAGDAGYVQVRATLGDSFVEIEVTDNGVGIPQAQLEELHRALARKEDANVAPPAGFALSNVWNRIQMIYGPQARMEIRSEINSGTSVVLILPIRR
ncbi:histidine kinase [Cohnella sp. GCM10027633]|uniref:histidine kinase n=1 Tax=unclassified Cohnella TaxID=2636738 RepID=UPI0036258783